MDYAGLKNYIATDPDNLGLAPLVQAGNYQGAADKCNAQTASRGVEIDAYLVYRYLVKRLLWRPIADAANNASHPAHAACTVAVDLITPGGGSKVNFADSDVGPLYAAFVGTGLMTTQNRDDIIAMSTEHYKKMRDFGAESVSAQMVENALTGGY